jgi:Tyrosine-protein kinase ephrin type A/B receptor-like
VVSGNSFTGWTRLPDLLLLRPGVLAMWRRWTAVAAVAATVFFLLMCVLLKSEGMTRRRLSQQVDPITGETVSTLHSAGATIVPRVSCPLGYWRPAGGSPTVMITGQRADGCIPCPRGVYGAKTGLVSSSCSGSCPTGRYGDRVGLTSASDCPLCPLGRYGSATGLTSSLCSGACPAGKYTLAEGASLALQCIQCGPTEETWPCNTAYTIKPRFDRRTGLLNT